MGEHKIPKVTAKVVITPVERMTLYQRLGVFKVDSKDTEWKYASAVRALHFDDDLTRTPFKTEPCAACGQKQQDGETLSFNKARSLEFTDAHLKFLSELPYDYDGRTALVMAPLREKLTEALDKLKKE